MLIEESRLLQVCIFTTLHKNVRHLEFSALLPDVVTIADEVDAQLKQQMQSFKAADAAIMGVKRTDATTSKQLSSANTAIRRTTARNFVQPR